MVNTDGSAVQLIDYDGMFVDALRGSTATEVGQLNFQHPQRSATDFNERLDRFSFLTLDVALHALASSPALWAQSQSEPSAIVFRRNDFLAPGDPPSSTKSPSCRASRPTSGIWRGSQPATSRAYLRLRTSFRTKASPAARSPSIRSHRHLRLPIKVPILSVTPLGMRRYSPT